MLASLAHVGASVRTKKRSIFLVDDHPILRRGMVELIKAQPDLTVCGEAACFAETYATVGKDLPDLVMTDISLEGNSGLELIKELNFRWPHLSVLAYSMHDEEIYAERVLRSGAKGYVHKQSSPERLLEAIRTVLEGKIYLSAAMSDRMLGRLVGVGSAKAQLPIETLSDRELEVLGYLGKGQTTAQIAQKICLSVKTIETYREHLKRKLSLKSSTELIRYAVQWSISQE